MVRETRHLWVGNLPENIREDRIKEYFKRFGRVQSVKILSHNNKDEEGEAATVAFMDIKSANKAHSIEHKIEDRLLKTDYYDPSSFNVDSNCDRQAATSPRPEDCGPGPGGGADFNENSRSSHSERRDFRTGPTATGGVTGSSSSGGRYDDAFGGRQASSRSSRSYRTGSTFDRNGPSSSHYSNRIGSSSWKEAPLSPQRSMAPAASSSVSGGSASDILSSVKSSSVYLNNDRGAASPMSTCSSTSSKRLNGHSVRNSSGRPSKLSLPATTTSSSTSRASRRRSRSSESGSDSSGSESGSASRSSSSSSSASSSSDNSRSTSNSTRKRGQPQTASTASTASAAPPPPPGSAAPAQANRKQALAPSASSSQGARPVTFDDKTNCAICIRNLPMRGAGPSDLSLQDFLLHEYNNVCNVRSVRIGHSGRHGRYAVIYLATMTDVDKALNEPRLIAKTYHNAEVDVMLASEEIVEDKRLYHRPTDAELEEFHPKATRTLFVGGLSRDVTSVVVQEKFERFGEILEIDIKKSPAALAATANIDPAKKSCYANVQFTDLSSVCKAIKECDGDSLAGSKITLGFARAVPTKCVWCSGVADVVKEKDIAHEFGRYGKIQDILILRSRGQALVWFDQTIKAQRAMTEMRGRYLKGSKLQADYASHECRAAFFEQCKNSGMDMKERSKPWEIHQPHLNQTNENSNSPDSTYRDKYDRRSERSCDSPRTSNLHSRSHGYRSLRSPSPSSAAGRYKPSTQAISPPRDSFSEGEAKYVGDLRDSLNRNKDRGRYHNSSRYPTSDRLKDPRSSRPRYSVLTSPTSSGDEKDPGYRSKKTDSGLSEDHGSTGSSGSAPSNSEPSHSIYHHRKHLKTDKVRRSSTDSARSSSHHDDLDLISSHFKPSGSSSVAGADDVSDSSRPGTPLCDEHRDTYHHRHHLRSSEPMSLPLPKFATQMFASQIQSSNSYLTAKKERDPRLKSPTSFNLSVSTCLKSPPPSLKSPGLNSKIIPEASGAVEAVAANISSGKPHDPRLGHHHHNHHSSLSARKPAGLPLLKTTNNLMNDIEDISDSDREEEMLEAPKKVEPVIQANSNQDPATMTLEERLKALDEKYQKWSGSANKVATPNNQTPATPCSTPVNVLPSTSSVTSAETSSAALTGGSTASSSASLLAVPKFSFDLKPAQPSPIVQQLLARKSVFDEDSKRLESLSSISDTTPTSAPVTPVTKESSAPPPPPAVIAPAAPNNDNFGSSYNVDRPSTNRSMSVDQVNKTPPVRPLLSKMNSVQQEQVKPVLTSSAPRPLTAITTTTAGSFRSSTTSNATPTIGQVRPVPGNAMPQKAPTLPISTPIKPLVDNKIRPLASTKPSATVTPTFKSSTTSHQAQSGLRRNSTLTTTTASTKSMCSTTSTTTCKTAVEKGEASSTTASPKTEVTTTHEANEKKPHVSPESSTHPELVTSCNNSSVSPPLEEESGVSSTTKELDIKTSLGLKPVKKEMDTFLLKDPKKMEQSESKLLKPKDLVTATALPVTDKKDIKIKHEKKERSSHGSSKERKPSTSSHNVSKKIKEMKDMDLKDLFAATDTIPNHVKKEAKAHHHRSKDSAVSSAGEKSKKDHHSHSHHKDHHSHSSHHHKDSKKDGKRRLSDIQDEGPKNKVAKADKPKAIAPSEMGRIPKIKKPEKSERPEESKKQSSSSSHGKSHPKVDEHKKHSSSSSKKHKSSDKEKSSKKRHHHHTSDEEMSSSVKKKHKHSKDKESKKLDKSLSISKDKENRRKSTSSQASNTSKKDKKKLTDESDFSEDESSEPKKQFSIFDDPIIDSENPVYFSMYDKVKARRSCVAKRDREENERRQQEALLAKFKKQLKAKRDKRHDSDSDEIMDQPMDAEGHHKKKKALISSSSEDSGSEFKKKLKAKAISDSSLSSADDSSEGEKKKKFKSKKSRQLLDSSDDDEDSSPTHSKKKVKSVKKDEKPVARKVPVKSATAKIKTEVSSSESDEDSEPTRNKAAATAVLVQNKKKAMQVKSKSSVSRRETLDSSFDSSDSSDSEPSKKAPEKPKRKSSSETEKQAKEQKEKQLDLDKKMSKIFGTSSDEETCNNNSKKILDSDEDRASDASGPVAATAKKSAKKVKKERNSSGRSSTGSKRETAESLFDQLTVKAEPQNEDYSAFAEGVPKELQTLCKVEQVGPLDQQLQEESESARQQSELDKSIASITEDVKEKSIKEDMEVEAAEAETDAKRSVISQEETDQAVTALLGESFENSFDEAKTMQADNTASMETSNMEESEEAAKAVAGLENEMTNAFAAEPASATAEVKENEEKAENLQQETSSVQPMSSACNRGRGASRGRGSGGRGGRSSKASGAESEEICTRSNRGGGRGGGLVVASNNRKDSSDVEMKSNEHVEAKAARGRGGGRGRGNRANSTASRRSSETGSTDSNKPQVATSVFDWPDMEEENEMASPTLKEKQRLHVETGQPQPSETQPKTSPSSRRSTASNRSSKESLDEQPQSEANTDEKIKAILEHASKQQEMEQLNTTGLSVFPSQAAPQQAAAAVAAMQLLQRASVLPRSSTSTPQAPQASTVAIPTLVSLPSQPQPQPPVRPQIQPPLANSPGLSVVQLPTQPLPASEIARTSKQVLLESKGPPASPKIPLPATSPRTASISLPTQPVPMSVAQLNSVASAIVARTMTSANALPMLPNQPLPQMAALHIQGAPQGQPQQAPKLPQHPLPPTSATSITPISTPSVSVTKTLNPKKRVIAQATAEEEQQQALAKTAEAAELLMVKKETPTMKPRDVFGRGAHLVKNNEEKMPSLATQEKQLAMIRESEITIIYRALVKQGHPDHLALSLAQEMAQDRYNAALSAAVALSNDNRSAFDYRQNPLPAHMASAASAASTSSDKTAPMAHANSRIPSTGYMHHDPYQPQANVIMNLNPPASPEPEFSAPLPNLDAYPMVWKGFLGLKNDFASVEFRYVSGCKELAAASLPHDLNSPATLRIGQRMRLEVAHLSGVRTKMQQAAEHCVLLALPCGTDPHDVAVQSRQLRSHFITYLQLKGAAGIINVHDEAGGYVVHVFPSCDFANETMTSIAPDLLAKVAEMEHMVIIIATVCDKTGNAVD